MQNRKKYVSGIENKFVDGKIERKVTHKFVCQVGVLLVYAKK